MPHSEILKGKLNSDTKRLGNYFGSSPILKVVRHLVILNSLALFSFFISPQLLNVNISEKLSFWASDGNCPTPEETFGKHCFGDFGLPIILIRESRNVWNSDLMFNPYTPGAMFIFRIFSHLIDFLGSNVATMIYLLLLFICAAIPIFAGTKNYGNILFRLSVTLCLTLTSIPVLIALDRGSSILFILPCIYFSYIKFSKSQYASGILLLLIATTIRPQAAIFFLILIINQKLKLFFVSILGCFVTLSVMFFFWSPTLFLNSVNGWFRGVLIFGSWGLGSPWPNNYSAAQGVDFLLSLFTNQNTQILSIRFSYVLLGLYLVRLVYVRSELSINQSFQYLIPLLFLYPTTSWGYYASILMISLAILLTEKDKLELKSIGMGSIKLANSYCFLLALSLSPLYIPNHDLNNVIQKIVPSLWVVYIISILCKSFFINKTPKIISKQISEI